MKLFFSEYKSDYQNYIFPYAIWAVPNENEKPAEIFAKGFLPNSCNLDRFYMCRHVRVALGEFSPSSENRRILRKGEKLTFKLLPKAELEFNNKWMDFCLSYAEKKFGEDVMSRRRITDLIASPLISHFMVFSDPENGHDVGIVFLYVEETSLAFYYYSFYDLAYTKNSIGMFMMTVAAKYFSDQEFGYIYLGSCYSRNALYKTQFTGAEFFNGFQWSQDTKELKYLIERDSRTIDKHLLENTEFSELFHPDGVAQINSKSLFNL